MFLVASLLATGSFLACTGAASSAADTGPVADYTLSLAPLVPLNGNPFDGVNRIDLVLDSGVGEPLRITLDAPESGNTAKAEQLPALDGTRVIVEGYADGELVAWGRSAPITANSGEVTATVFVSTPETMAQLGGLTEPAALGAGAALGDGRFVFLGGSGNRGSGALGKSLDGVSLLDLANPTEALAFESIGTMPSYIDADGNEQTNRQDFTMTRLTAGNAGQFLVVGGGPSEPFGDSTELTADARLFDPETLEFTEVLASRDTLTTSRAGHVAIANQQGGVLVWGGMTFAPKGYVSLLTNGELYDSGSGAFSPVAGETGSLGVALADLGADGTLVTGGASFDENLNWSVSDVCLRVSLRGDATSCNGMTGVAGHAMIGLSDGDVLSFGGVTGVSSIDPTVARAAVNTVWRFRHGSEVWEEVGQMKLARAGHTATLLNDTHVLIAGGASDWGPINYEDSALSCVEVYNVTSNTSDMQGDCNAADDAGGMPTRAQAPLALVDPDLGVLLVGGVDGQNGAVASASLFSAAHAE